MTHGLVIAAAGLSAASGIPGLGWGRAGKSGERIATMLLVLGAVLGMLAAALALTTTVTTNDAPVFLLPWLVPGGAVVVAVDAISAIFLLPICLIAGLGSIYGLGYWPQHQHQRDGRKLRLFYGLTTGALIVLVCARNTMFFLAAWEVMALSAFMALTSQDDKPEVREVGYVYLVATRVGTLCLFAMFALLFAATGEFTWVAPTGAHGDALRNAIFVLGLLGFGLKAGIMPLHIWLPGAHARAPSHLSALLSGVLIKSGIYGLVRLCATLAPPPAWWGVVVLALGVVSGVLGVAFAIGQHDLKRLLAYHSVENIGIICIGLGIALLGRSLAQPQLVVLGIAGALLHVWNHGLFKALLFLAAGSVLHATGTREMDRQGGLGQRMPLTALAFVIGAVAICGLPPLNGFVSELFIYLGLFRSVTLSSSRLWLAGAVVAPVLAVIGALALACFVKAFGTVFLGQARSDSARHAHEASQLMVWPMGILAVCCVFIGLLPFSIAPVFMGAAAAFAPELVSTLPSLASLASLSTVSIVAAALWLCLLLGGLLLRARTRRRNSTGPEVGTWDCGFAVPTARMQYSASSLAQTLVGFFAWALRPRVHAGSVKGIFARPSSFHADVPDVVLDIWVKPALRFASRASRSLRFMQSGSSQAYVLGILLTLLTLLCWR